MLAMTAAGDALVQTCCDECKSLKLRDWYMGHASLQASKGAKKCGVELDSPNGTHTGTVNGQQTECMRYVMQRVRASCPSGMSLTLSVCAVNKACVALRACAVNKACVALRACAVNTACVALRACAVNKARMLTLVFVVTLGGVLVGVYYFACEKSHGTLTNPENVSMVQVDSMYVLGGGVACACVCRRSGLFIFVHNGQVILPPY